MKPFVFRLSARIEALCFLIVFTVVGSDKKRFTLWHLVGPAVYFGPRLTSITVSALGPLAYFRGEKNLLDV